MSENREYCNPDIVFEKAEMIRKVLGEPDDVCVNTLTALSIITVECAHIKGVKKKFFLKMLYQIWDNVEFQLEREKE